MAFDRPIGDSPIGDGGQGTPAVLTKRQQVIDALRARLEAVLQANGFQADLGLSVREWDTTPLDPASESVIVEYRDMDEDIVDEVVGEHMHRLPVEIRIRRVNATLADIRRDIGDITNAIGLDVTFGQLAEDTNQSGPWRSDKAQAGDVAMGVSAQFVIEFTTERFNAYF